MTRWAFVASLCTLVFGACSDDGNGGSRSSGGDAAAGSSGNGGVDAAGGGAGVGGSISGTGGHAGDDAGSSGQAGSAGSSQAGAAGQSGAAGASGSAGADASAGASGSAGTAGSAGSGGAAGTPGVDAGWDATGSSNDCCAPASTLGCSNPAIEECVCKKDGACCVSAWDGICVNEIKTYGCGVCPCKDECTSVGQTQCNGNAIVSCVMGSEGCLNWEVAATCTGTETCQDSSSGPSCVPVCGPGMVAGTTTSIASGITTITEHFVAADSDPAGHVYVGGTDYLYRMPKVGGPATDVEALAGLTTSQLGYAMVIAGSELFLLESKLSGTTGHVWRISTDNGSTWNVVDYATFPQQPEDWIRAGVAYKGKLYAMIEEWTSTVPTEIWEMDLAATPPVSANLAASISGVVRCSGLAMDDYYYYLACATADQIVRVDRTTNVATPIVSSAGITTTVNAIHAHDTDGDGKANFLYYSSGHQAVRFVCDPAGNSPMSDVLVSWGTATTNYGLGFEPSVPRLWVFDETKTFLAIE